MDFFERQEQAHRNTKLLVIYFIAAILALIVAVYFAALLVIVFEAEELPPLWLPQLFFSVTVGTLMVVIIGSATKIAELSRGGSAVAALLGGRLVNPNTIDLDERRLLNAVEEMAIASGVPVPQTYVLPEEKGINAFAAGYTASDAVIAVTQGSMKLLTRDELQGVIGHEFSHILNGDMRLNLRLMGLVFGILCLTTIGRILLRTRGRRNALPLFGVALMVLGAAGALFGRLIQAAVSRQHEFLADASSVQFTRNPSGLAGALKKIGGLALGSRLNSVHAEEASHMFFGNGLGQAWFGLMATHPPLEERIRAMDPSFDGKFSVVTLPEETKAQIGAAALARQAPEVASLAATGVPAGTVIRQVGETNMRNLQFAAGFREALPQELTEAVHDPMSATALIYGLLLSDEAELRAAQLQQLVQQTPGVREAILRLRPVIAQLAAGGRLPLIELTLPALRRLSVSQYRQFADAVQFMVDIDRRIDLFEYVLRKIVFGHLDRHFRPRSPVVQYHALKPLAKDCAVLLSALASSGHNEPSAIGMAFREGVSRLPLVTELLTLLPPPQCDLPDIDRALDRLTQAAPQIKKVVLDACAHTAASDGLLHEREIGLLSTIAHALDCPLPPLAV